ncbi:hypothetical protein OG474_33640 [Kribbella sp. NBC_01505]|uniref:hypothetical protein n=1 Tax=Kribbella sp. NBC_01505 TaxID=2903580 RepID=UPI00386D5C56
MSKFLGFLLGVAVALAGPAVFGVLGAPGGIQLNTKEMALAYGVGALVFWAVVSYFSGAGAIGAFLAFGTLVYCWLWIPNRTTNFLNDVPGVTTGMVEGTKQYTLNGVVPILTVISLVYSIQLIVRGVQRRRRARVDAERLQHEQEAAQAQQEAAAAAVYPVAASTYPAESYGGTAYAAPAYEPSSRYDDLFDEEPERPRNQADEQTAQFPVAEPAPEQTAAFSPFADDVAQGNDETVLVPSDRDETTVVAAEHEEPTPDHYAAEETAVADEETRMSAEDAPTVSTPVATTPEAGTPVVAAPEAAAPAAPVPAAATPVASTPSPVAAAPVAPEPAGGATESADVAGADDSDDDWPEAPAGGGPVGGGQAAAPAAQPAPTAPAPPAPPAPSKDEPGAGAQRGTDVGWQAAEGFGQGPVGGPERVGQQYRERMEDPEDTGEFHVSAFEGPFNTPGIRPAGA